MHGLLVDAAGADRVEIVAFGMEDRRGAGRYNGGTASEDDDRVGLEPLQLFGGFFDGITRRVGLYAGINARTATCLRFGEQGQGAGNWRAFCR